MKGMYLGPVLGDGGDAVGADSLKTARVVNSTLVADLDDRTTLVTDAVVGYTFVYKRDGYSSEVFMGCDRGSGITDGG